MDAASAASQAAAAAAVPSAPVVQTPARSEHLVTLGLPAEAVPSAELLRKQYRKQALMALHNGGVGGDNNAAFRRVQVAYDALREEYHSYGDDFFFQEDFVGEELFEQLIKTGKAVDSAAPAHPCGSGCPTCLTARRNRLAKLDKKKVPRNAGCPCGSGNKYKKCCLKKDELAEKLANQRQASSSRSSKLSSLSRKKPVKGGSSAAAAAAGAGGAEKTHANGGAEGGVADEVRAMESVLVGGGAIGSDGMEPSSVTLLDDDTDSRIESSSSSEASEDEEAFSFEAPPATNVFEVSPAPASTPSNASFSSASPFRGSSTSATAAAAVRARVYQRASAAAASSAAAAAAAVSAASSQQGAADEESVETRKIVKGRRFSEDAAHNETDWLLFKQSGEDLLETGNAQEAITFFTQGIACKPNDAALVQIYLSRAKAYQTIGLVTKSRYDCIKAAELLEGKKTKLAPPQGAAAAREEAGYAIVRDVTVESVVKLQIRLAPLLASIGALREWVSEDNGRIHSEFEAVLSQLDSAEAQAKTALANLQQQLVDKVLAADLEEVAKK